MGSISQYIDFSVIIFHAQIHKLIDKSEKKNYTINVACQF